MQLNTRRNSPLFWAPGSTHQWAASCNNFAKKTQCILVIDCRQNEVKEITKIYFIRMREKCSNHRRSVYVYILNAYLARTCRAAISEEPSVGRGDIETWQKGADYDKERVPPNLPLFGPTCPRIVLLSSKYTRKNWRNSDIAITNHGSRPFWKARHAISTEKK